MFRSKKPAISVSISKRALESIFDECDRYDHDETGGRLIGTYRKNGTQYDIQVVDVIGPGPKATRSPVSFFQDGEYQEEIFRAMEAHHPDIEHLGNWHTHHMNGLQTLSGGDRATYFKTVNHDKHNTEFFYALLVVRKNHGKTPRYEVKHFLFFRNDETIYEIPHSRVRLTDTPPLLHHAVEKPLPSTTTLQHPAHPHAPNLERAKDQEFFADFYPNLKALLSKSFGALYWKGSLELLDGSRADVLTIEDPGDGAPSYSITATDDAAPFAHISATYRGRQFRSARHAVLHLEKDLNQAIYRSKKG